ncbi:hypothetical protein HYFRA_00012603 [Hymenoscyphus fraxineus]|uniref:Cytochrome P450 n=1 Tax=Hymenoscyphus fraxineus TaxID=746836 RepID=A0A9N9L2Y0_9HELO|nr:hypothetical protein HYFRA_00012603 [Hymenoscyphus fraxineus]
MLADLLSRPVFLVLALCVICFLVSVFKKRGEKSSQFPRLPIIGARKGDWFPHLQAKWRNTKNFKVAMQIAYTQHKNRAVIMPVASGGDSIMLPSSEIDFVTNQPDSVLSFKERALEIYQIEYTFMDSKVNRAIRHDNLLRTVMTPQLGPLTPVLADEVDWAFKRHWGTNTAEWQEVCVFETLRHIVGIVANRVFVGLPFCRDPGLVNSGMAFAIDIPLSGAIMNLFWKPLRPFVAPLVTIPNRIHTRRFRNILKSEIDRRLRDFDARQADPEDKSFTPEPNDFLQWAIQQAKALGDPYMWRNETLADRLLILNFAALHTSSLFSTWAIFDVVSSTPQVIDELREEIRLVLSAHGGQWTKRALAQLEKLDSAMHESARLNSILAVGLRRVVLAENGLTTPSGVHLPKGTHISVPVYSVMRDDTIYEDAEKFVPFRFVRQSDSQGEEPPKRAPNTFTTTSPNFLIFGHGKHACPGRYFAATALKLVLANAILHYDFETVPVKPEGSWYGDFRLPPKKATIRIKRRG